jgi:hypothetical protein
MVFERFAGRDDLVDDERGFVPVVVCDVQSDG